MNNHYHTRSPQPGPACEYFAPLLSLVGQERLDPRDSSRLRQHLATCDYCQSELDGYTQLDDLLSRHFGTTPRGPLSPADIRDITSRDYRPRTAPPEPMSAPQSNGGQRAHRSAPPARPTRPQPARRGRRLVPILSAIAAVFVIAAVSVALFESRAAPNQGKQHALKATPTADLSRYFPQQGDNLNSVFMVSSTDGWAVGSTNTSTNNTESLILHYTGTQWDQISAPTNQNLHTLSSSLQRVFMVSASEGWAIGNATVTENNAQGATTAYRAFILHYSGDHWAQQGPLFDSALADIFMTSASNGWAVGAVGGEQGPASTTSLLLHYNGRSWTQVQAPGWGLSNISMTSASDGWIAGNAVGSLGNTSILLHYTGSKWVQVQKPSAIDEILSLSMVAASDGWMVGLKFLTTSTGPVNAFLAGSAPPANMVFAHYNGTTWTNTQTPLAIGANQFASVSALYMDSPTDGWAVGSFTGGNLYFHYSGGKWTQVRGPGTDGLLGVFMLSTGEGWAVGNNGSILRYQNGAWSISTSASSPTGTPTSTPTDTPCNVPTGTTLSPPGAGTPVPTIPLTTWATYSDASGFSIKYPAGWQTNDYTCGVGHLDLIFTNYHMEQVLNPGLPPGAIKIELTLSEGPQSGSALDFWQQIEQADQQAVGGPACLAFSTRQLQVAGRAAVEGGCPALNWDSFIIPDGKNMLDITESAANGVAPSDVLTQMVNTLTFTT
ncbi:MAG TPA: hypothetical protein VKT82_10945 [Ktedonobacterales bacterium]|nr:hypothetical protein [Ktedonobacterales bacterium]